jgi:hypothetical protein
MADLLIGVVVLIVIWWVLRGLLGLLVWVVSLVTIFAVVVLLLVVANRLRGDGDSRRGRPAGS